MPRMPLSKWLKNGRRKGEKWIPGLPNLSLLYKRFARKAERNKIIRESNEKPEKEKEKRGRTLI